MTDKRKDIKVTEDVFERHNERRKETGLSWSEYLRRCEFSPAYADEGEDTAAPAADPDAIAERVVERLDVTHLAEQVAKTVVDRLR